ncbi:Mg2+ transporter protein CorA-like/Zinc transport protein ZntB [Penicillium malachiteum]|uniref:Mg2+ transporter protein CorA-like/Zinc transport protein ZntB n=1 Tax=Penicillium malachiteum TaxID=1324776 RepID=A0AAD6MQW8_9EURO|nr:Mg2+ transporter protein CorA-like/Zinc transport protein ZntB [Penicillium malachiteum]
MPNNLGETPYLIAAKCDATSSARVLIKHGANQEARDQSQNTALHLAASEGSLETVELLVGKELELVNQPNLRELRNGSQETPLLVAIRSGKEEILLKHGADSNAQDDKENTALHLAAKNGLDDIVRSMFDEKSTGTKLMEVKNMAGETPYLVAARDGELSVVKLLREYVADSEARDNEENTALHLAAKYGDLDLVEEISDETKTAIESLKNKENETPLTIAARERKLDAVEYLLSLDRDRVLRKIPVPNDTMMDDFLYSAKAGYLHLFKTLLEQINYPLKKKDKSGKSAQQRALDLVVEAQYAGILDYLLSKDMQFSTRGMDRKNLFHCKDLIKERYEFNETALLIASENAHADVVAFLCNARADLEAKDLIGYTPLHNAVYSRSEPTVKALVDRGANQAAINNLRRNALHLACFQGEISIVKLLLNDRSDRVKRSILVTDESGDTPLCVAISVMKRTLYLNCWGLSTIFLATLYTTNHTFPPDGEKSQVSQWLTSWIQRKQPEEPDQKKTAQEKELNQDKKPQQDRKDRIKTLIWWAILNHDADLLKLGMKEGGLSMLRDDNDDRNKATWLHLAAMNAARLGHHKLILHLPNHLSLNYSDSQNQGEKTLSEIIGGKDENIRQRVLKAIIQETEDEENLISFTVATPIQALYSQIVKKPNDKNGNQNAMLSEHLEAELWNTVINIIQKIQITFFEFPQTENAELCVKTIIWRDTMGIRNASPAVKDCLAKLKETIGIKDCTKWNHLHWAVSKRYPLAVYGLLSTGKSLTELEIKSCEDAILRWADKKAGEGSKERATIEEQIRELLRSSPPVRSRKDDDELPEFLNLISDIDKQKSAVIDLSIDENQLNHGVKRERVYKIAYAGPENLMATNGVASYQHLKNILCPSPPSTGVTFQPKGETQSKD